MLRFAKLLACCYAFAALVDARPHRHRVADAAPVLNLVSSVQSTGERLHPQPPISFSQQSQGGDQLTVYPNMQYQSILGWGGAFTEASAVNWLKLPSKLQDEMIQAYYNTTSGNGYTWGRVPINSCDFVDEQYNFDNTTDDFDLKDFDMDVTHDSKNIIPLVQAAQKVAGASNLRLFATPWSPPGWMKTNGQMDKSDDPCLKKDPRYSTAWANYFVKFFDAYRRYGIGFWGLTIQNEPLNANSGWESCYFSPTEELAFFKQYLYPALQQSYPNINIMFYDHNKDHALEWANVFYTDPEAFKAIWGLAIHWYSGDSFDNVRQIHDNWPTKPIMATEACNCPGVQTGDGGWTRAEAYVHDIIGDLNSFVRGWTDWNLLLDQEGGPNHVGNFCDAPLLANLTNSPPTLVYQDSYYAMGTFSRFLPPGSIRIANQFTAGSSRLEMATFLVYTKETGQSWTQRLADERGSTAEVVIIIYNPDTSDHSFELAAGEWFATVKVPAHSFHAASFDASILNVALEMHSEL